MLLENGADGPPVNCCTMARKLVVSVLSKVVGVRLEALDRLLIGLETRPSGFKSLELPDPPCGFPGGEMVVETTVESSPYMVAGSGGGGGCLEMLCW